jgi:hypothetical protein
MFAIGRSAPEVMEQLGHSGARLTLRVYARAIGSNAGERARLKALVEGDPLRTLGHWPVKTPSPVGDLRVPQHAKTEQARGIRAVEPTGIEPVTSCLQIGRRAWRVVATGRHCRT